MKIKSGTLLVLVALASLANEGLSYDELELVYHYEPAVEASEPVVGVAVEAQDAAWQIRINNLTQNRTGTVTATEEEFAALIGLLLDNGGDNEAYSTLEEKLITEAGGDTYLLPLPLEDAPV
jgi:hypothetical protein